MTAVDAQALADTVRETLLDFAVDSIARTGGNQGQYGRRESALAALDGLVEALGQRDADLKSAPDDDLASARAATPVPVRGDGAVGVSDDVTAKALRMCARQLAVLRQGVDALAYLPAAVEADVDDVVQEFLQKATGFGSEEA